MPLDPKFFGKEEFKLDEKTTYILNLLSPRDYCRLEDIIENQLYCSVSATNGSYLRVDLVKYIQLKTNPYYLIGNASSYLDFLWCSNKADLYYTHHYDVSNTTLSLLILKYPETKIPGPASVEEYYLQRKSDYAPNRS